MYLKSSSNTDYPHTILTVSKLLFKLLKDWYTENFKTSKQTKGKQAVNSKDSIALFPLVQLGHK